MGQVNNWHTIRRPCGEPDHKQAQKDTTMTVNMHLFEDLKQNAAQAIRALVQNGAKIRNFARGQMPDDNWFAKNALDCYAEMLHRRIAKRPREVRECNGFACPDALLGEYMKIVEEIRRGDDLAARQTDRIETIGSVDDLLNEWGIHHLHFSKRGENGWEKDMDELLYVFFTDDVAYIIAVGRHGDFCDSEMVAKLRDSYPELFPHLKGATPTAKRDKDTIKNMRKFHINQVDILPNGAVSALGGLSIDNGKSMYVYGKLCWYRRRLDRAELIVRQKFQDVARRLFPTRPDIYNKDEITLRLVSINDNEIAMWNEDARLYVSLLDGSMKLGMEVCAE